MSRVFISHSSYDRDLVERAVIAPLTRCGVETWYSKDNIETADDWERSIRRGLNDCDWFLVALTPRALASDWVRTEVAWAVKQRCGHVIPAMLENCDPGDLYLRLETIQHVDFRRDGEHAIEKIVGLVKPGRVPNHACEIPRLLPWFFQSRRAVILTAAAIVIVLSVTLALYRLLPRENQAQPAADSVDTRNAPAPATPARDNSGAIRNSSADANRQGSPRVTFTPLPERINSSNIGGNK